MSGENLADRRAPELERIIIVSVNDPEGKLSTCTQLYDVYFPLQG